MYYELITRETNNTTPKAIDHKQETLVIQFDNHASMSDGSETQIREYIVHIIIDHNVLIQSTTLYS